MLMKALFKKKYFLAKIKIKFMMLRLLDHSTYAIGPNFRLTMTPFHKSPKIRIRINGFERRQSRLTPTSAVFVRHRR
jgi:hypothetical protein